MNKRIILRGGDLILGTGSSPPNPPVFSGGDLYIEDGRIAALCPAGGTEKIPAWEKDSYTNVDVSGLKVFPGLIDIHIHGACGHDFIEGTAEAVDAAALDVVKDGVTAFAASLTVVSHARLKEILRSLAEVRNRTPAEIGPEYKGARFLGIHSEGPFIDTEYKALMDDRYIRPPNETEFEEMIKAAYGGQATYNGQDAYGGQAERSALILMTFSPRYDAFPGLFPLAQRHNIVMMIGHSAATADQAAAALDAGAAGYTHLYNAMSPHHHRNPGVVSAALSDPRGFTELIADTIHVCPRVLRFTYNGLGSGRIILVSDAMPGKSMEDGEFIFSNLLSVKKDGKAWVKETGRLAGSVMPLNEALRNMANICGAGDAELAEMASANPAKLLGLYGEYGSIAPGKKADLAIFDNAYKTVMTLIDGEIVFST